MLFNMAAPSPSGCFDSKMAALGAMYIWRMEMKTFSFDLHITVIKYLDLIWIQIADETLEDGVKMNPPEGSRWLPGCTWLRRRWCPSRNTGPPPPQTLDPESDWSWSRRLPLEGEERAKEERERDRAGQVVHQGWKKWKWRGREGKGGWQKNKKCGKL